VVADVRLDPHLGVDEAVRADHEILKSVETNAGQSHEHTRVVQIVFFQVEGARVVFDECVTVGERHHHDQRVRFGGLVGSDAHEHLPVHLQSGLAPCSCHLHVWKGATDSLDGCERVPAAFIADPLAR
jgi:ABC-type nickel/cobalt efflux system permease component RcnA